MNNASTDNPWEPARWALLSGVIGVIANVLLLAFYALSQPWHAGERPYGWVGTVNDVFVAAQYAALIPVAFGLRAALQRHRLGWVAWLGMGAMMLIVLLQALLVAGVMKFRVEGIAVSLCIVVAFGWMLAVVRISNREGAITGRLATLGTGLGVAVILGLALVGLALLLPKRSVPQYILFGIGGAFGLFAWFGFPFWLLWGRSRFSQMGNRRISVSQ
jgi:hypothetical protein